MHESSAMRLNRIVQAVVLALMLTGCGKRETLVSIADRNQELRINNFDEPSGLDPQMSIGNVEHNISVALFEGLVMPDLKTFQAKPAAAESWDISPDGLVYTFHLHKNGRWSNGEPLTAQDFVDSYKRMLTPSVAAQYSYMLYPVTNAEAFNSGKITNFDEVGFKAVDPYTLRVTLHSPTPYLLLMMIHESWFPVPVKTILKYGALDDRGNPWTCPGNFVGNGPFALKEWRMTSHLTVVRNTNYWDASHVRLNEIYFDPTVDPDTAERMFQSGQIHSVPQITPSKVSLYRKINPKVLYIYPLLGTYLYKFNVTKPPLNDKRVREALAMAIDRKAITEDIMRAGQEPAYFLTPPNTAGYTCAHPINPDVARARQLLAEAGFPDGKNFPKIELLFNVSQTHKAVAEALQDMWKKNLNIDITLHNEEWKVYLDSMRRTNYYMARASWIGDYVDPNTFLEMFTKDSGNNETGWSNAEYDRLIHEAANTGDQKLRFAAFQKAEAILMDEMPVMPVYFYTQARLLSPSVKGWVPNLLDTYNFKDMYLEPGAN